MATHVVVDGSNIATEGREAPSLAQLNEAVLALLAEHPETKLTVVVDATFGHRIGRKEVADFDAAIANNEIVCPPAGAMGRGDGFVLMIADKVKAAVLSNDSFQEFQDEYPWLFDEGRLVGGKPVPNVGWVFITRLPVRKKSERASRTARAGRGSGRASGRAAKPELNEEDRFEEFVRRNPVGAKVRGVVEGYSSHGIYVAIDGVRGYLPLKSIAKPAPRSGREYAKPGANLSLVVVEHSHARRSVDVAVPGFEPRPAARPAQAKGASRPRRRSRGAKKR
ncbi:MAG: NYN domain-containing protein [Actinomycetota bacterium]|jgi:hypothetical protein